MGNMVVARIYQIGFQTAYIQSLSCFQPKRAPCQNGTGGSFCIAVATGTNNTSAAPLLICHNAESRSDTKS